LRSGAAPFVDLRSVQTLVDGDKLPIAYGAQDLSPHPKGAYYRGYCRLDAGQARCSYVVVGHSERREYHAEDDAIVKRQGESGVRQWVGADPLRREGLAIREAGWAPTHWRTPLSPWR